MCVKGIVRCVEETHSVGLYRTSRKTYVVEEQA